MWRDVVELGKMTESLVLGETIYTPVYRKVFCKKASVRSREFYESRLVGMKPEMMFVIRSGEFDDDVKLKYKDKEYDIIRTYDKGEFMELIVSSFVNV